MRPKRHAMVFGVVPVLLLLLVAVPGTAVAQTSAEPQPTAPPPRAVIPVAEVATQATEVTKLLRTLSAQGASNPAIATIDKALPEVSGTIDLELAATSTLLQGQPTLRALQTQEQRWQRRQLQTTGWLHALTGQATQLQQALHRLADLHTTWTDTRVAAQLAQAPAPILQQIDATLSAIAAAQMPLQTQYTAVLNLQSRVAHEVGSVRAGAGANCPGAAAGVTGTAGTRRAADLACSPLGGGAQRPARARAPGRCRIRSGYPPLRPRSRRGPAAARRALPDPGARVRRGATADPAVAGGWRGGLVRPQGVPAPLRGRVGGHVADSHLAAVRPYRSRYKRCS